MAQLENVRDAKFSTGYDDWREHHSRADFSVGVCSAACLGLEVKPAQAPSGVRGGRFPSSAWAITTYAKHRLMASARKLRRAISRRMMR